MEYFSTMCDKRSSVECRLHKDFRPKQAFAITRTFRVDPCLRDKMTELFNQGIITVACCCGHGRYPETIIVKKQFEGLKGWAYYEFNTKIAIHRTAKFYQKDKKGFFYIPEISSERVD